MPKREYGRQFIGERTGERLVQWLRQAADEIEEHRLTQVKIEVGFGRSYWWGVKEVPDDGS